MELFLYPVVLPAMLLVPLAILRVMDSRQAHAAEARAQALLGSLLSEDELRHLKHFGCLMVPSPRTASRIYCIPRHPGTVEVYESEELVMRLCLQPVDPLPSSDVVLAIKLMIEGSEDEFLRIANRQRP